MGNKLKNTNNVKLDGFGTFAIKEKTVNVNGLAQNNNYIKFKPSTKIKPKKDRKKRTNILWPITGFYIRFPVK